MPVCYRHIAGQPDPTRLEKKKTALIMVEYQIEHLIGQLPIQTVESLIEPANHLLDWADKHKIKVFHLRHLSKSLSSTVFTADTDRVDFFVTPRKNHEVITKYTSSIFAGTLLHTILTAAEIDTLIIAGLETPTTISASAHDACLLGYKTIVAGDLCAARDILSWDRNRIIKGDQVNDIALAAIADKFGPVLTSAEISTLPFA